MKSKFEILEWDSNFFDFRVAMINSFDSIQEFSLLKKELKFHQIKLAYMFCKPKSEYDKVMKSSNIFLADEKVTFSHLLNEINDDIDYSSIKEYQDSIVTDKMLDIAIQTSEYSRFRVDDNFKNEEFKKMYFQWIKNAVVNKGNDRLFVYEEDKALKGLIYLKEINSKIGSISLIGVDQGYRGEKIGSKLINKAKKHFKDIGKNEVHVITQKQNVLACNFYQKNGFNLIDTTNVYHLWL